MTRRQFVWALVAMLILAAILGWLTAPYGFVGP